MYFTFLGMRRSSRSHWRRSSHFKFGNAPFGPSPPSRRFHHERLDEHHSDARSFNRIKSNRYGRSTCYRLLSPQVFAFILGQQILDTLENGVSMYPKLEGRFPQVAGVSFAFTPNKPSGKRIDTQFVRVGDEYLKPNQHYRLATKSYLHNGCDGFVMLKDAEILVSGF